MKGERKGREGMGGGGGERGGEKGRVRGWLQREKAM